MGHERCVSGIAVCTSSVTVGAGRGFSRAGDIGDWTVCHACMRAREEMCAATHHTHALVPAARMKRPSSRHGGVGSDCIRVGHIDGSMRGPHAAPPPRAAITHLQRENCALCHSTCGSRGGDERRQCCVARPARNVFAGAQTNHTCARGGNEGSCAHGQELVCSRRSPAPAHTHDTGT